MKDSSELDVILIHNNSEYGDLIDFANFHLDCSIEREGIAGGTKTQERLDKLVEDIIDNLENELFLLFKKDNKPIGTCAATIETSSEEHQLHLWSLFVKPEERKKGYGTQILREIGNIYGNVKKQVFSKAYFVIDQTNNHIAKIAEKAGYKKANLRFNHQEQRTLDIKNDG